jgi:hypothetical protein
MIWTLRITFLLFLAWIAFLVSPFLALYDFAKAVEARDVARIEERVNFRALRISLTQQIVGAYLKSPAGEREYGDLDRRAATNAGAVVLNPLVERLVTPQALIDLLKDGPPRPATDDGSPPDASLPPLRLDPGSAGQALRLFMASEGQGFRSVTVPLPPDAGRDQQFRLTMRLSGTTWRLTGIGLPEALRQELIRRAPGTTSLNR